MVNRLRSRILISLSAGMAVIALLVFLTFFGAHPDEKALADYHRGPLEFSVGFVIIGVPIGVAVFGVLSLLAWGSKRRSSRASLSDGRALKLYSPNQAFGAAALGGPLAAMSVLKTNYITLGNPAYARKVVIAGWSYFLAFIVALIALALWKISLKSIGSAIGIANAAVAKSLVRSLQRDKHDIMMSDAYSFKSNWRVVGLGVFYLAETLLFLLIMVTIIVAAGYKFGN